MSWKLQEGEAHCPPGFVAGAVEAAIKTPGRLDLALVASKTPCSAAAMFTKNLVKAAPVLLSTKHLRQSEGKTCAVLFNSGCANAATGEIGMQVCKESMQTLAEILDIHATQVLAASTGVIGVQLPAERMLSALPKLASSVSPQGLPDLARAIMTTDTKKKMASATIEIDGRTISIAGVAKGAGMIHPDMATMLVLILTDAVASPEELRASLQTACQKSFHKISIDGDSSTNDSVFCLASGASEQKLPAELFTAGLAMVCRSLALQIVRDGEGAKKLITVTVVGAANDEDAQKVARAVSSSLLVRTAVAGGDPNWGRILAAVGRAGATVDPDLITISVESIPLFERGKPCVANQESMKKAFAGSEVSIGVDLASGSSSETLWTCDLTQEYVRINADYTT